MRRTAFPVGRLLVTAASRTAAAAPLAARASGSAAIAPGIVFSPLASRGQALFTSTPSSSFSTSARLYDDATSAAKTVLYDFHVEQGGKIVSFAGYAMPLTYADQGQVASHKHTREAASLFDVSHMVQHHFEGAGAADFLEWLTPSALKSLKPHSSTLSVLLNRGGGILDDTVITKISDDKFYVVTNAGRRREDLQWFEEQLAEWTKEGKPQVKHTVLEDQGLVALQGPQAAEVLGQLTDADLKKLTFGQSVYATVAGVPDCHIARGGYTGEDGFEISISPKETVAVSKALLSTAPTKLAGLAARDSLRLEAGMCLYGNDLDATTSPIEGGLTWVVSKERRTAGSFIGSERVLDEIKNGPKRRRVGLVTSGPPARAGSKIFLVGSPEPIGVITSGIPSPTVGGNVAMGYVANGSHKRGTEVEVEVRGKRYKGKIEKMPFVENRFYRGEK